MGKGSASLFFGMELISLVGLFVLCLCLGLELSYI